MSIERAYTASTGAYVEWLLCEDKVACFFVEIVNDCWEQHDLATSYIGVSCPRSPLNSIIFSKFNQKFKKKSIDSFFLTNIGTDTGKKNRTSQSPTLVTTLVENGSFHWKNEDWISHPSLFLFRKQFDHCSFSYSYSFFFLCQERRNRERILTTML